MFLKMSMSIYDKMSLITQREADEDKLYSVFFGHEPIQPMIEKICDYMMSLNLPSRYSTVVEKVRHTNARDPKIAMIMFAMWLCPELNLQEGSQPRRSEPFMENIERICLDLLKGKHLSVQEFVDHAVTDYLTTPKRK